MADKDNKSLNFVKDNCVYIHGSFCFDISKDIIPELKKLIEEQKKLKEGKIIFDICSPGGYIQVLSELLALIKQAKEAGIIVETRSMSVAASCGAMLLVAGTEGHRYGSSYLQVLVHHSTQWSVTSTDEQIERDVNRRKFQNTWLRKHLEDSTNIPKKELDAMLSDDGYYVYGDNLLKFGIVDHII